MDVFREEEKHKGYTIKKMKELIILDDDDMDGESDCGKSLKNLPANTNVLTHVKREQIPSETIASGSFKNEGVVDMKPNPLLLFYLREEEKEIERQRREDEQVRREEEKEIKRQRREDEREVRLERERKMERQAQLEREDKAEARHNKLLTSFMAILAGNNMPHATTSVATNVDSEQRLQLAERDGRMKQRNTTAEMVGWIGSEEQLKEQQVKLLSEV